MTKVEALKKLFETLGGDPDEVVNETQISEMINKICDVAEGGGGESLYVHNVWIEGVCTDDILILDGKTLLCNCKVVNNSETPFTFETFRAYVHNEAVVSVAVKEEPIGTLVIAGSLITNNNGNELILPVIVGEGSTTKSGYAYFAEISDFTDEVV